MDKFQFLTELCERHGYDCEFKTNGSKHYAVVSKDSNSFVEAASWESWTNTVIKIFPRATVQTVNISDKERVAVFYLGDIVEILRG